MNAGATVLVTYRLRLRAFTEDDVELLVALDADPAVTRYLTGGVATPVERVRDEVLPRLLGYDTGRTGWGYMVAHRRDTDVVVGWFELCPDARTPQPPREAELGYRLFSDAWGRGYATEGATALLAHAFDAPGTERVWATTMAVNAGSRRVLEKVGLRHVDTTYQDWPDPIPGSEHGEVVYEITRTQWTAGRR